MKIGIDASRYEHGEATGVEWYSWHIINGLIKEAGKDDKIVLYSRKQLNIAGAKNKVLPGQRFWTLRRLSAEMRMDPPDVLFVPSHVLPLSLPGRSVITIHDVAFRHLRSSYSFFAYHYLNWSTKFAVKHATKIIVPSEATKKDLMKFFKCPEGKIEVIMHGFEKPVDKGFKESEIFKYFGIKKALPFLLFVGRLESKKNLVRLVKAFKEFSEKHAEYRLILAGKRGIGFDAILKTVKRLGLMEKVIMPGYVTEEEKAALYKYCKVFVFPSLYEGFGLPILEAFYYGKPVLTSTVSCLPEVAGEAAYYVDPKDISAIAAGLDVLVKDKTYVKGLVGLGKERLKLFSWKHSAKKTLWTIKQ